MINLNGKLRPIGAPQKPRAAVRGQHPAGPPFLQELLKNNSVTHVDSSLKIGSLLGGFPI